MVSQRHYQVIILGDSLAARLAGVFLAKGGCRVLSFGGNAPSIVHPWFYSSLHLERILEWLSGQSCFIAPIPFQLITPSQRVEFNGPTPLEEELRREFPAAHVPVKDLLDRLAATGERLENLLLKRGGLPWGALPNRLFLARQIVLHGPWGKDLHRPLSGRLSSLPSVEAREAFQALFQGLARLPVDHLTIAEGALLWSGAARARSVSPAGLDALLSHRYEQFHGETDSLAEIQEVRTRGHKMTEVILKNGARCGADHFLIGSPLASTLLPPSLRRRLPSANHCGQTLSLSVSESEISSLLAPRVILAGTPPLRLNFAHRESQILCTIDLPRTEEGGEPNLPEIRARLQQILPFVDIDLRPLPSAEVEKEQATRRGLLGATGWLRSLANILYCHGSTLLPSLGTTGEVLVGLSAANALLRRIKK